MDLLSTYPMKSCRLYAGTNTGFLFACILYITPAAGRILGSLHAPSMPLSNPTGSFCYGCVVTSWGPIPYLAYLLATALVFVFPAVYSYESKVGGRVSFQELFALRFAMALMMALRLKHNGFNPVHHACDSMFKLDRSMWRPLGCCCFRWWRTPMSHGKHGPCIQCGYLLQRNQLDTTKLGKVCHRSNWWNGGFINVYNIYIYINHIICMCTLYTYAYVYIYIYTSYLIHHTHMSGFS